MTYTATHSHPSSTDHLSEQQSFGITALTLSHFRNFSNLSLPLEPAPIVLTAPNGSGKTNILEAISLFSPGKGLKYARFSEMQQQAQSHPWQVGLSLAEDSMTVDFGTALIPGNLENNKRIVKCQGEVLKTQAILTDYLNIVWFTPSMGSLLSESGQIQRQFVDRLVFSYDPAHAKRRSHYDKLVRERSRILKEYGPSRHKQWLDPIEEQLSELSYDILQARSIVLNMLEELQSMTPLFPRFTAVMRGDAETFHQHIRRQDSCVQAFQEQLLRNRPLDATKGITSTGPHRSKLHVVHQSKGMPAEFCSTGEQKMLVLAIILAFVKMKSKKGLLLLLDDVADHLDDQHRTVLLEDILSLSSATKIQVWMTGSNAKAFEKMAHVAQFLSKGSQGDFS